MWMIMQISTIQDTENCLIYSPITMKSFIPCFLILLGLFILFFISQPIPAGIFLLLGIVMIIEQIWPEKWRDEENE